MPQNMPTELHDSLRPLEGDWTGEGEVYPNPWGPSGPTQCAWKFRMAHSGFHMIHDYREVRDGSFRFEAHGVISVDPSTESIVWFLFDDYGFPPVDPARGGWKDGCLELVKSTPRGVGRTQLELSEQGLVYTVDFTPPGADEPMVVARSTLRRV